MSEPDLTDVQRVARATCAELHARALASGYLTRGLHDPGQYRAQTVWPIALAMLSTGLVEVKP